MINSFKNLSNLPYPHEPIFPKLPIDDGAVCISKEGCNSDVGEKIFNPLLHNVEKWPNIL